MSDGGLWDTDFECFVLVFGRKGQDHAEGEPELEG